MRIGRGLSRKRACGPRIGRRKRISTDSGSARRSSSCRMPHECRPGECPDWTKSSFAPRKNASADDAFDNQHSFAGARGDKTGHAPAPDVRFVKPLDPLLLPENPALAMVSDLTSLPYLLIRENPLNPLKSAVLFNGPKRPDGARPQSASRTPFAPTFEFFLDTKKPPGDSERVVRRRDWHSQRWALKPGH